MIIKGFENGLEEDLFLPAKYNEMTKINKILSLSMIPINT